MLSYMTTATATQTTTGTTPWAARPFGGTPRPHSFGAQVRRMRLAVSDPVADGDDGADTTAETMTDSAERRRGLRVRQVRPVKLLDMGRGRTVTGQTLDVSTTGLRIELPTATGLRVGDVLGIHVGLSRVGERLANRRGMVPVRIVWVDHEAGRDGHVLAGVEYAATIDAQRDAA